HILLARVIELPEPFRITRNRGSANCFCGIASFSGCRAGSAKISNGAQQVWERVGATGGTVRSLLRGSGVTLDRLLPASPRGELAPQSNPRQDDWSDLRSRLAPPRKLANTVLDLLTNGSL